MVSSVLLLMFGSLFGTYTWYNAYITNTNTPLGTIMLVALPLIIGFQLFLFFLQQDISLVPKTINHFRD